MMYFKLEIKYGRIPGVCQLSRKIGSTWSQIFQLIQQIQNHLVYILGNTMSVPFSFIHPLPWGMEVPCCRRVEGAQGDKTSISKEEKVSGLP